MNFDTLDFELRNGVAHIALNRPDAQNAFDIPMGRDLMEASIRCDEDPSVRAVVLSAKGKRFFSAGGDLKAFKDAADGLPVFLKRLTTYLHAAVSRFMRMDAPLVVAVNGAAAGIGMSIALCGDFVIASKSARFNVAYTGVGLTPDGGSTWLLPRLVGLRRAQELIIANRVLKADEALAWNLVTQIVSDDALLETANALAAKLADGPKQAYGSVKRLLAGCFSEGLETQMELEARSISSASGNKESREGIAAFIGKRAPDFRSTS